jgi:hypothetical protein
MQHWATKAAPFCNSLEGGTLSKDALNQRLDTMYSSLTSHILKAVSETVPSRVVGPNCRSCWDEELQDLVNVRSEAYLALP